MPNHRFGRDSAWHTLEKMRRDLARMKHVDETPDKDAIIDAAQDVAIGGWAVVDRLIASGVAPAGTTKKTLEARYPELSICQKMANEGKHANVRVSKEDVSLEATVSATVTACAAQALHLGEAFSATLVRGDGTMERRGTEAPERRTEQPAPGLELVETRATYRAKIIMMDGGRAAAFDVLSQAADTLDTLLIEFGLPKPS